MSTGRRVCSGDVLGSVLESGTAEGSTSSRSSLFPSVCKRFSRPSTRFSSASRTSVLGPLFFGTASAAGGQLNMQRGALVALNGLAYRRYTGS